MSALVDEQDPGVDLRALETHLAGCPACRAWREEAYRLARVIRIGPATGAPRPDPAWKDQLVSSLPRQRSLALLRGILAAIALAQVAITVPLVALGRVDVTHDLGAVDAALAVGFALVAWRPRRAPGVAPVVGTAAVLLVASEFLALAAGHGDLLDLGRHLVVLAGWLLVHRIARDVSPDRSGPDRFAPSWSRPWSGRRARGPRVTPVRAGRVQPARSRAGSGVVLADPQSRQSPPRERPQRSAVA